MKKVPRQKVYEYEQFLIRYLRGPVLNGGSQKYHVD